MANERATVVAFSCVKTQSPPNKCAKTNLKACLVESSPDAKGLVFVLSTLRIFFNKILLKFKKRDIDFIIKILVP